MKDLGSMLLHSGPFREIVMGNTALVRGMVEAGVEVVTSYPGSPTPEIASAIMSIPAEKRLFYFEYSVNEKVASEVALGASVNGRLSVVFFKSVGLNVAADSFVQFSLLDIKGGLVIVLGDDPGANSSQNEQDNRHLAKMAYTPILEPSDPSQVYTQFLEACRLSIELSMPVILRMTTHVCHAKTPVDFGSTTPLRKEHPSLFRPSGDEYIPLVSTLSAMKARALKKLALFAGRMEDSPHTFVSDNGNREKGIITCGLPFKSLEDVLENVTQKPDILCLAGPWPIPDKKILEFCRNHREVAVLEELDPVIEQEVKSLLFDAGLNLRIRGKEVLEYRIGEMVPSRVRSYLSRIWPDLGITVLETELSRDFKELPPRPPQMCPGCGHRSAFHAIKEALSEDDITVADIGCHTLGYLPPYQMGNILLSMGHSSGTGAGLSLFNPGRRVVSFLGDSTFFHAGLPGIINALYNRHNITLILMENGTTAMTGHQENPGTGKTVNGEGVRISIRKVLEGLGVPLILEVDTYQQKKLADAVKEAMDFEGFSVVIARHPCMLKFTRDNRRKGIKISSRAWIDPVKCSRIHDCVSVFACPSFILNPDDGTVTVNSELCIGDGSCLQTCPVKAIELKREESHE
ncbi:MAG: thiamine pyrophosphate-dependent enzyme [Spirochaetia bacterium]|jgi:indolepyruvate ferredoxin oxidoreductase alpha subunit|nr:thiamine pyrophosphate-dependent enzyme [Spirochaetia bacterium]